MTSFFLVKIDDEYLSDDGNGNVILTKREEAYLFEIYEQASDTAFIFIKGLGN